MKTTMHAEFEKLKSGFETMRAHQASLTTENASLQTRLATAVAECTTLRAESQKYCDQRVASEETVAQLRGERDGLAIRCDALQAQLGEAQRSVDEHKATIGRLAGLLEAALSKLNAAQQTPPQPQTAAIPSTAEPSGPPSPPRVQQTQPIGPSNGGCPTRQPGPTTAQSSHPAPAEGLRVSSPSTRGPRQRLGSTTTPIARSRCSPGPSARQTPVSSNPASGDDIRRPGTRPVVCTTPKPALSNVGVSSAVHPASASRQRGSRTPQASTADNTPPTPSKTGSNVSRARSAPRQPPPAQAATTPIQQTLPRKQVHFVPSPSGASRESAEAHEAPLGLGIANLRASVAVVPSAKQQRAASSAEAFTPSSAVPHRTSSPTSPQRRRPASPNVAARRTSVGTASAALTRSVTSRTRSASRERTAGRTVSDAPVPAPYSAPVSEATIGGEASTPSFRSLLMSRNASGPDIRRSLPTGDQPIRLPIGEGYAAQLAARKMAGVSL